jgi:hypothetical protein
MDDPEGNLVIGERVVHENQCMFPQTSTVGTVVPTFLAGTQDGTHTATLAHGGIVVAQDECAYGVVSQEVKLYATIGGGTNDIIHTLFPQ